MFIFELKAEKNEKKMEKNANNRNPLKPHASPISTLFFFNAKIKMSLSFVKREA